MRSIAPVLFAFMFAACGGGGDSGGGGSSGGGGGSNYFISVSPTIVSLTGLSGQTTAPHQLVSVTFRGDGVVVGMPPGQTLPPWLSVSGPATSTSPASVDIVASQAVAPGIYSTTLRFVTGKADGSNTVFVDVPITYNLVVGQAVFAEPFGQAAGSTVSVSFNGGAAQTLAAGIPLRVGTIAAGSSYTISVPMQPTGQTCSFADGNTTFTGTIGPDNLVRLRVTCNASLIPWTWVGGPQTLNEAPVYGTPGVEAASNTPGGRRPAAHARDSAGNLWVFGGLLTANPRNDLWRYNVNTGQWTLINGGFLAATTGIYGTLGTPSTSNRPGARTGAVAWFDSTGKFWLFGGNGYGSGGTQGFLNDLWMYDIAGDTWTWMGGGNTVDLGSLGTYNAVPSTTNIPGGRQNAAVARDSNGDVWLFGGYGAGAINSFGQMNDLWRFTPSTRIWKWVRGDSEPKQTRVQGTIGVPSPANTPGARDAVAAWTDANGNFWTFGGSATLGLENDLWRYQPVTDMWTWMGGTDRTNPSVAAGRGTYNPPGAANNYPTSRGFASAWTDSSGNLWLFGGYGQAADINVVGPINDLWKYTPSTNTWSWLSGSNAVNSPAIYGTQGTAANTNVPSGRQFASGWTDNTGRLWLWGGATQVLGNNQFVTDVWRVTL